MTESFPSKIYFSGGDLPDGEYVINADFLNQQYNDALKNFDLSEVHEEGSPLYIYFRAMWIGYAAAAAGTRNYVRNNPVSTEGSMADLSPAALKVWSRFCGIVEEHGPARLGLAAALLAVADQVAPENPCGLDCCITQCEQIRAEILGIAAELKAQ